MATSGTFTFDPTADDVLTEAWELCGKSGAELTGDVARAARRSLFKVMLHWTSIGLNLWQVDKQTMTLVPGTATYALAVGTIAPLDVLVTVDGKDRALGLIGRGEYVAIPTKGDRGVPASAWTNRQARVPTVSLYPTPDAAYTLTYWRLRQPQDVGCLCNTLDIPLQWWPALTIALAAQLALKYAPEKFAVLKAEAAEASAVAMSENTERGVPMRFTPDFG